MNGCGFPNDDSFYTHPTHQEHTMKPFENHGVDFDAVNHPNEHTVTEYENELFRAELTRYASKLYAGTDAETFIAGAAEDLIDEGITFISMDPKKIARVIAALNDNTTFPGGTDSDVVVREDADGIHLTNHTGSVTFTDMEEALDGATLVISAVSAWHGRQKEERA